ncbi:MAG TPA: C40 family peptidase [Gemmatimonadaceae bacterium]|nr:C40 family peptidase [Gemmatimonadaceae bacterium]
MIARPGRALAGGARLAFAVLALALPRVASAQKKTTAIAVRGTVTGADIVRAARDYLGVRYVWGGDTPRAFDCSGFTRYVFARYGIALPRTAHEQAAFGDAPFPGDLRPGDLLFFSGGQGAQHIAIYVGGDTIIHASSSAKRVKLDMIKPHGGRWAKHNWFRNRLIAVRRVLPMEGTFYIPTSAAASPAPATTVTAEGPSPFRRAPTVY